MTQMLEEPPIVAVIDGNGIPLRPTPVRLTEVAVQKVKEAMAQEELDGYGLRVGVTGGGCSGLNYLLDFSEKPSELDLTDDQYGLEIMIDPFSASHLDGTVIDYVDDLNGSGFKFNNPHVTRTCGCGQLFQP